MNFCYQGDCNKIMRNLISEDVRVQCIVTSPPYFGLRDYGMNGQIGMEASPEEYIAKMVEVFRLARDLLSDDGTLWLNIGDSYANYGTGGNGATGGRNKSTLQSVMPPIETTPIKKKIHAGLKPKDLIGIPWMLAFALRADGWYLRQDIIWHKPNPMPESVRDRCTKAHEHIFLLAKNERYFFDNKAIEEPISDSTANDSRLTREGYDVGRPERGFPGQASRGSGLIVPKGDPMKRNKRSVWTVPTKPFAGAHFAVFPPALIEPCILAGSRPGDVVFDPFMGSGTTAQVAQRLGRQWLGAELNPEYIKLQNDRTRQQGLALGTA